MKRNKDFKSQKRILCSSPAEWPRQWGLEKTGIWMISTWTVEPKGLAKYIALPKRTFPQP